MTPARLRLYRRAREGAVAGAVFLAPTRATLHVAASPRAALDTIGLLRLEQIGLAALRSTAAAESELPARAAVAIAYARPDRDPRTFRRNVRAIAARAAAALGVAQIAIAWRIDGRRRPTTVVAATRDRGTCTRSCPDGSD